MSITGVHHLNAATLCPRAPARLLGQRGRARMVCHCLLLETARDGLILVDTGFGTADLEDRDRVPRSFRLLTSPVMRREETLLAQLAARGFAAADVRHIVVTHLDLDHAGGLSDFPTATVHLHQRELAAAETRRDGRSRMRYRPAQWAHGPKWQTYREAGDTWRGVPAVRQLAGVTAEVGLLPMHGHTQGHSAVLVGAAGRWLLHAGDAYFHRGAVAEEAEVPVGLRLFEARMRADKSAWRASVAQLRQLRASHADLTMFCAHDIVELAQAQAASAASAAGAT
jgi:glyoxylase-like metal-dependent hydrolase (beta-lactamase superfamily II)